MYQFVILKNLNNKHLKKWNVCYLLYINFFSALISTLGDVNAAVERLLSRLDAQS